ncbi:MAG TPA: hypothetical protein ACFYEK_15340, partial [Candidatus Wunengus sp. YC60]|uniref:hypothetical protein n=1 Tax=Candidatus Wunengus sp. YC60 TaxID=3367697 RepID=UPI00402769F0
GLRLEESWADSGEFDAAVVDPKIVIRKESLHRLLEWARAGRVLVMPRSGFYTQAAQFALDQELKARDRVDSTIGIPHEIYRLHQGHLIIYDVKLFALCCRTANISGCKHIQLGHACIALDNPVCYNRFEYVGAYSACLQRCKENKSLQH